MQSPFPLSRGSHSSAPVSAAHARCRQRVWFSKKAGHTDFYLHFVLENNSETFKHSLGQGKHIYRQDEYVNCKCVISNGSYLSVEIYTPKMHNLNLLIRKYQTNKNSGIAYKTNSLYSSQMSTTPYSSQIPMS